jgi:hypothetical protein
MLKKKIKECDDVIHNIKVDIQELTSKLKNEKNTRKELTKEYNRIYKPFYHHIKDRSLKTENFIIHDEVNMIYEDDRFFVINPLTYDSVMYYGKDTKWCISRPDNSDYKRFTDLGAIYYIIIDDLQKRTHPYQKVIIQMAPFGITLEEDKRTEVKNQCPDCKESVLGNGYWDKYDNHKYEDESYFVNASPLRCAFRHPLPIKKLSEQDWPKDFINDIILKKCV